MAILTPEQTKEILDGAIEKIRDAVIDQATSEASWHCKSAIEHEIREIVRDFVKSEIAPEIITSLNEKKSVIIEAAIVSAENMATMLAESMAAQLAENLGKSYQREKIFKEMFS